MSVPHWYLIVYDIRCPKRLRKVHRFVRKFAYALQESVFIGHGSQEEYEALRSTLSGYIKQADDDLRFYQIPNRDILQLWGVSPFMEGVHDSGYPPCVYHTLEKVEIDQDAA